MGLKEPISNAFEVEKLHDLSDALCALKTGSSSLNTFADRIIGPGFRDSAGTNHDKCLKFGCLLPKFRYFYLKTGYLGMYLVVF